MDEKTRKLAEEALRSLDARKDEDVEAWAARLARDSVEIGEADALATDQPPDVQPVDAFEDMLNVVHAQRCSCRAGTKSLCRQLRARLRAARYPTVPTDDDTTKPADNTLRDMVKLWPKEAIDRVLELEGQALNECVTHSPACEYWQVADAYGCDCDIEERTTHLRALYAAAKQAGWEEGWDRAHEPAKCGHARANYKDPKYGTSKYAGEEECEFCAALAAALQQHPTGYSRKAVWEMLIAVQERVEYMPRPAFPNRTTRGKEADAILAEHDAKQEKGKP
jgi:hypothetical protein